MRAYGSFTRLTAKRIAENACDNVTEDWFDREVVERARKRCANSCHVLACQREGRCLSAWPNDTNSHFLELVKQEADSVYVERMNVLLGEHTLHRNCGDTDCVVCNGGLALCVTCGGAEAALPTECPGRGMTGEELDGVQSGLLNYYNGRWETSGSEQCVVWL